jgi:hypothetical protein
MSKSNHTGTGAETKGNSLSLTPEVWGPSTWISLHLMTLSYPEKPTSDDKQKHRTFLYSLAEVLPCSVCREHFQTRIKECIANGVLDTRESYVKCMWDIHRAVNPEKSITFDEFVQLYKTILERGHLNPIAEMQGHRRWKTIAVLAIIATVGVSGAWLISSKKWL